MSKQPTPLVPTDASAAELARLAKLWRKDEHTTRVVPVVGAGLNIQAARAEGGAPEDNWAALLQRLAARLDIPPEQRQRLPQSFIQQWETIVRWHSVAKSSFQPFRGEGELQAEVCGFLRELERRTHAYALYRRFASAGFQDIISLNFDRRLALSLGCEQVESSVPEDKLEAKRHGRPLFRFSRAKTPHGTVRIWYPHGDSKRKDTLKLGVRVYGMYIAALDELRRRYMKHWTDCDREHRARGRAGALPPEAWDDIVRGWDDHRSWASVFMSAPLIFIGCGLGEDEWPLWWLINQRARHTTYLDRPNAPRRPETIVLTAGSTQLPRFAGDLCYIQNLHFATHDAMWQAIEASLLPAGGAGGRPAESVAVRAPER